MESFDFPLDCYAECCGPCGKQCLHLFALFFFVPHPPFFQRKIKITSFLGCLEFSCLYFFIKISNSNLFYSLCE